MSVEKKIENALRTLGGPEYVKRQYPQEMAKGTVITRTVSGDREAAQEIERHLKAGYRLLSQNLGPGGFRQKHTLTFVKD